MHHDQRSWEPKHNRPTAVAHFLCTFCFAGHPAYMSKAVRRVQDKSRCRWASQGTSVREVARDSPILRFSRRTNRIISATLGKHRRRDGSGVDAIYSETTVHAGQMTCYGGESRRVVDGRQLAPQKKGGDRSRIGSARPPEAAPDLCAKKCFRRAPHTRRVDPPRARAHICSGSPAPHHTFSQRHLSARAEI